MQLLDGSQVLDRLAVPNARSMLLNPPWKHTPIGRSLCLGVIPKDHGLPGSGLSKEIAGGFGKDANDGVPTGHGMIRTEDDRQARRR